MLQYHLTQHYHSSIMFCLYLTYFHVTDSSTDCEQVWTSPERIKDVILKYMLLVVGLNFMNFLKLRFMNQLE